jgi:DNA invertase Pin-like site-specific DNA recombinase
MQVRELREYCHRRGWTVAVEYVDSGVSGMREKRPELDRLLADAHHRRIDAVVVWRLDRFARRVSVGLFSGPQLPNPSENFIDFLSPLTE